jgi:signal transduction histidine kinase
MMAVDAIAFHSIAAFVVAVPLAVVVGCAPDDTDNALTAVSAAIATQANRVRTVSDVLRRCMCLRSMIDSLLSASLLALTLRGYEGWCTWTTVVAGRSVGGCPPATRRWTALSEPKADPARQLDGLRREADQLRASRRRLVVTDDAERRKIERALHDDVQQHLVGLAAGLELAIGSLEADPLAAKQLLAEMRRDVQRALEDARRLAHRISPPLLEAGGLVPALRTAAASAGVPTRIDVEAGPAYPPEIAGVVYLCCLQVLEHAGAGTPVTITVRNDERALGFEVVADCDLDAAGLALGDRVEALGGRLTFSSEPDHRSRLVGSVPLSG